MSGTRSVKSSSARAADDLAKPPVDEKEAAVQFALQHASPGLLEDAGEPLLAGAQRLLGADPTRGFDDGDQHAADTVWSGIVRDRTVAQRKARIFPFGTAAPLNPDQQVLGEVGAAGPVQYRIYIDADACPVKQEIYRVAERHALKGVALKVFVVSNSPIAVPRDEFVERVVVGAGMDEADNWIAERAGAATS
jgi:hypothetical protein